MLYEFSICMVILFESWSSGKQHVTILQRVSTCRARMIVWRFCACTTRSAVEVVARAQCRQSRLSPLRRAGGALKATNGAHGAELGELSGLLHAGLVKREPEDLSRKVVDEPEPHALKPPRHKVRHMSVRRRRARTHSHTATGHSWIIYRG